MDSRERRRGAALDAIARVCARDLSPVELVAQVAERLRWAVPCAADGWMFLDPQTLMFTGGIRPDQPLEVYSRVLDNEFRGSDVNRYRTLARASRPAATLWQATGGRPERSPRYREILSPLGCGDELRAVFRTGGSCWGGVSLARGAGHQPFSEADVALVTSAGAHIADALRGAMTADGLTSGSSASPGSGDALAGMLVLDGDDAMESWTPEAARLLRQASEGNRERLPLPVAVYSVAHQARAMAAAGASAPRATARVRLPTGPWLTAEASPLRSGPLRSGPLESGPPRSGPLESGPLDDGSEPSGRVAVALQSARPVHLAPLVLAARGLTGRERQIARLLLRGDTTEHIARHLVISRHTLRDHLKAIYAKLGVTSRPEFTALLLHEEASPHSRASGN